MKFTKLQIRYNNKSPKEIAISKDKEFKNFNKYFENDENIIEIAGISNHAIYTEFPDHTYIKKIYNELQECILVSNPSKEEIKYPRGKKIYDDYILEKKKEKLEKILRK